MATGPAAKAATQAAGAIVARLMPFTPPWLLAGATFGAANVTHTAWVDQPGPVMAATLASAALTAGTAKVAPDSAPLWRWHATATTALATGAMPLSATVDPMSPGALSAWAILGIGTALSWNIRKLTRNGGETKALPAGAGSDLFDKVARLKGTKVLDPVIEGQKLTATLELPPGELTVDDVQSSRKHLAGALGIHERGVTVREDPERSDRAHLSIVVRDLLKEPIPWPGPSRPGACISEPIRHGIYDDGRPAEFWLPGDPGGKGRPPRPVTHLLFSGMTGAGKGESMIDIVAEIATRRRVAMWMGDPGKGSQTLQDIADAFEWVAIGVARTRALINALPDVITARADRLGRWGYKQWVPEVYDRYGMPFLYVHIEEASRVLAGNKAWVIAGQEARSAGVSLGASAQVFDHTVIPRKSRGQFPGGLIHGQGEDIDASYVTPDEVTEAGGDPVRWGNTQPGMHYLVAPGVPRGLWATPVRSYMSDPEKLRKVIAVHKALRAVSDPVTVKAAGAAFANRGNPISLKEAVADARSDAAGSEENVNETDDAMDAPVAFEPPVDSDAEDLGDVDIDQEIPTTGRPATAFAETNPFKPTPAQARAALEGVIERLRIEGREAFAPNDLAATLTAIDRKRPWLQGELAKLVEAGRLDRPETGTYRWTDRWQDASALVEVP
ncbi:hypothetical protein ACFRCG_23865 [Embleya sp. NPDC056575]|uniref:hypothetical protein n=1 Tax=unclassified Embleya TaxID=2699296 RepID=UPI0036AC1B21